MAGTDHLDDIVQDCFIKVWKNLDHFESRSSLKSWVYRIAVNTAKDHWRKRARSKERAVERFPEKGVAPVDVETRELVRRALLDLSVEQRETVVLHYYEGLSVEEI
jgi:RNA polymerase sigma-70 factor (ECF subfamily)